MGIGDEIRTRRLGGVRVSAQHVFTNRMPEREAFDGKAAELRERVAAEPDLIHDFAAERRNVLSFYGDGGIGKTSLSRELERLFLTEEGEAARCAVRVDFSEPTSLDPEVLLLQVRAGLASLGGFPAFDTALAVYWARQNPGTPLAEFVARQSSLGVAATRDRFARDLAEFTQSLVDSAGLAVGGASRAAKFAWRQIQDALVARDLRRNCPFFEQVVTEPDIDQFRLHLPLLLAWDLTRLQGAAAGRVGRLPRHVRGCAEPAALGPARGHRGRGGADGVLPAERALRRHVETPPRLGGRRAIGIAGVRWARCLAGSCRGDGE